MAKDPAFLFYPGDWLGGTMGMSLEEKGGYLELLILQFNTGKFTEAQAKLVLSICFDVAWDTLRQKFKTDGTFYWNERLQEEKEKRQNFTNSRKNNALTPKKPKKHMHKHMENENINENIDSNETAIENFLVPEMLKIYKKHLPNYKQDQKRDAAPLLSIAKFLIEQGKIEGRPEDNRANILQAWEPLCSIIAKDNFFRTKPLKTISNQIQEITQIALHGKSDGKPNYGSQERAEEHNRMFAERYGNG